MVCTSADHSDAYPVALIPAGKSINDVDALSGVEVVDGTLAVDTPDLKRQSVNGSEIDVCNECRVGGGT
jgi:hypothetical protein